MRVIWLCNLAPGAVNRETGRNGGSGSWIERMLEDIRTRKEITLLLLCPGDGASGALEDGLSYSFFPETAPHKYSAELEERFCKEISSFHPDLIHIWGTEYGHTLAMVNAARRTGMLSRVAVSIQGLCGLCARHYSEGVPDWVCRRYSLRDFVKHDNIRAQQHRYALRGELEENALRQVRHVIGRTAWDRAVTGQLAPDRVYHFCNETLRSPFYEGIWQFESCTRHHIFSSSCAYPVKGFHYLLEAMPIVLRRYPDATISVPGKCFFKDDPVSRLRQDYYHRYLSRLAEKNGLRDKLRFSGALSAQGMREAYLNANVFVLPSTIENSPNSLGEAMLLGVPCVAADVGGVSSMLKPDEGFLYPSTAPYMLADCIMQVFALQDEAARLGKRARARAMQTHDPEKNLRTLLKIYEEISGGVD